MALRRGECGNGPRPRESLSPNFTVPLRLSVNFWRLPALAYTLGCWQPTCLSYPGLSRSPDGRVKSTRAVGGHPLLVQACLDAVKEWKFAAAPEESTQTIEFEFTGSN